MEKRKKEKNCLWEKMQQYKSTHIKIKHKHQYICIIIIIYTKYIINIKNIVCISNRVVQK